MDGDVLIDPVASLQAGRQVVIVFPPLGGQRVNLGRQLYENDRVFRETMQKIDEYTARLLPVRLVEVLYPGARDEAMYAAVMQQPQYSLLSTFAIEVALAMSCKANLREEDELYATLGHSVGEFASAVISGALSLESATALVCERGRLMEQQPTRGSMMAVRASSTDANRAIDRAGERVVVACDNGPRAVVLSGEWGALSTVLQGLAPGVQVTRVSATHADHSPAMAPLAALLGAHAVQLYAQETPQSPEVLWVSTVTGHAMAEENAIDPMHWSRHFTAPVLYQDALSTLLKGCSETGRPTVVLEMGEGMLERFGAHTSIEFAVAALRFVPLLARGDTTVQSVYQRMRGEVSSTPASLTQGSSSSSPLRVRRLDASPLRVRRLDASPLRWRRASGLLGGLSSPTRTRNSPTSPHGEPRLLAGRLPSNTNDSQHVVTLFPQAAWVTTSDSDCAMLWQRQRPRRPTSRRWGLMCRSWTRAWTRRRSRN
jgi:acyl transferase domain-containing protein